MTRIADKALEYQNRATLAARGEAPFTHKQRGELESEIWALVPAADRRVDGKCQGRGPRLALILGGMRLDYDIRSNLLTWGSVVDVLWERVELDMTLSTAVEILRTAKKMPGELEAAIRQALADYDARPNTVVLPGGKVARKHAQNSLPSRNKGKNRRTRLRSQGKGTEEGETIWVRLRGELGAYVAGRLEDLDPRIGEEIYRDFERDLNELLGEYQSKITRVRSRGTETVKVSRRLVIESCAVLSMDPPGPGKPVDLAAARKQQRKFAKLYHPDVHMGDESMRAQYERVMQAYERLDAYTASLGKNGSAAVVETVVEKNGNKESDHGRGSQSGA